MVFLERSPLFKFLISLLIFPLLFSGAFAKGDSKGDSSRDRLSPEQVIERFFLALKKGEGKIAKKMVVKEERNNLSPGDIQLWEGVKSFDAFLAEAFDIRVEKGKTQSQKGKFLCQIQMPDLFAISLLAQKIQQEVYNKRQRPPSPDEMKKRLIKALSRPHPHYPDRIQYKGPTVEVRFTVFLHWQPGGWKILWKKTQEHFYRAYIAQISSSSDENRKKGKRLPEITLKIEGKKVKVEVAMTPGARSRGLMYRKYLPPHRGMLFVYPEPGELSFWMKNTYIPLSLAFINQEGKIVKIHHMKVEAPAPSQGYSLYSTEEGKPARYALEVVQGWFEKRGVKVGDRVQGLDKIPGEAK